MRHVTINVQVNFPALQALVDFLNTQQQGRIDELTNEVKQLTEGLQKSNADLAAAVEQVKT